MEDFSKTDWHRLDRMTDDEVDTSDIPPLDEDFFAGARAHAPKGMTPVAFNIDTDVLNWFKRSSNDYRSLINQALKTYAASHKP